MSDVGNRLKAFKALVDDALRDNTPKTRQEKAAKILSNAHSLLSKWDFKELERYAFEELEK